MTLSKYFFLASFAALFFAAAVPATAFLIARVARKRRRFDIDADAVELGQELGLWFAAVACTMFAAGVWWR